MTVRARLFAARAAALLLASVCAGAASAGERAPLTFEQRVDCRRAVEQVRWNHRAWPKENPGPKPSLAEVLPDAALRAKVEAELRTSGLLADYWRRPATAELLQGEIDRMVRGTKAPKTLRELFAALGDDPYLIAECLARPALERRLAEQSFSADRRIHGPLLAGIEAEVAALRGDGAALSRLSGRYVETTLTLDDDASDGAAARRLLGSARPRTVILDRSEFAAAVDRLRGAFGLGTRAVELRGADAQDADLSAEIAALPRRRPSRVEDEGDRFVVRTVLDAGARRATIGATSWPKRGYEEWAATQTVAAAADVREPAGGYAVSSPESGGCAADMWTPTAAAGAPNARAKQSAVWTGGELIVWGGGNSVGDSVKTGGAYDPATDAWIAGSLAAGTGAYVPSARQFHSAVWTGREMIVWGGRDDDDQDLATGGRYNPTTDAWSPSSLTIGAGANVPAARDMHTAVWTGREMIVWGGQSSGNFLPTGGRYNPDADTWASSSLTAATGANVPAGRVAHSAVWTGREMIVWGGQGATPTTATGGRYNPTTDAWAASSLATGTGSNVPSARCIHAAVWTGREMIVWGGYDGGFSRTGGRYDPEADTWATCSLTAGAGANVPEGRAYASAVWTGSEMIVWGGMKSAAAAADGGLYNPVSDSWASTSLTLGAGANVPAARMLHAAVWTGAADHRMIVWGGLGGSTFFNSGGLYCAPEPACASQVVYRDRDGDGHGDPAEAATACVASAWPSSGDDCNDADATVWSAPSEVASLSFRSNKTTLAWSAAAQRGGTAAATVSYRVFRNTGAPSPGTIYGVLASGLATLSTTDAAVPPAGAASFYLVGAFNGCGGTLGAGTDGTARTGATP